MDNKYYIERLNKFKRSERPEVVLLLVNNPDLVNIVIAWTSTEVKHKEHFSKISSDSEKVAWEWLWENTNYNLKDIKEKTGTPLSKLALEEKMKPLIGNRIIYPDGTVNSFVERYLREQVLKLFESYTKRQKKNCLVDN